MSDRPPPIFRVQDAADIERIPFRDGVASVEVPIELVDHLPLKNDARDGGRLRTILRSVRSRGFQPHDPIIVRIGRRGRWVVEDGGHRLTAARQVAGEFWANLFGRKVYSLHFLVYADDISWKKTERPDHVDPEDLEDRGDDAKRASWRRAFQRMRRRSARNAHDA